VTYAGFLEQKARHSWRHGSEVAEAAVHPMLHDWQRRITTWACQVGRGAIFADCGLGKTFMQVEWGRLMGERTLILAPLSVARQTVREARKIDVEVSYVRSQPDAPGLYISNYEMVERFDPSEWDAVVLDESSILKNVDGKTRRLITERFGTVPFRLACTATPAPNDVAELTNHAAFLGVMSRAEMLAAFFVHDERDWRLKGHARGPMFEWMASWAVALRRPSDLGWDDAGYILPPLRIHSEIVDVTLTPDGQLFAVDLGGIGGRAKVRRSTLTARVERAAAVLEGDEQAIAWCGLNDEARGLAEAIPDSVNVEGSWDPERKAEALEAFQDGAIRVLVTKPSIAGFGMNFQNAHRMAFVGLGDSYESYYQAIRRCWRFGQTEPVDVHVVVSDLEQAIVENVRRKETESMHWGDGLIASASERVRRDGWNASKPSGESRTNGNGSGSNGRASTHGAVATARRSKSRTS
jgi:superfamily II DNA or RNA helicase